MSRYSLLFKKYETICAVCDKLYADLQIANETLQKGTELVDQLMDVMIENERLKTENERLIALLEGTEPTKNAMIT